MMNSKENYYKIVSLFIVLIASTIVFRSLCTVLIILFAIYNIVHFKYLEFPKAVLKYVALFCLPLLFELIFFWNNATFSLGLKSLEKYISLLIFSVFILGNYKQLSFFKIINQYRILTTSILFVLFLRFLIVDYELVAKYLNGVHLWEMGYKFAESFKNHAPAVNMHVAFLVVLNTYFLLRSKINSKRMLNLICLSISVFLLFILNTRIALAVAILGCFFVVIEYFGSKFKPLQVAKILGGVFLLIGTLLVIGFKSNPYMKEKYGKVTFMYMDKIGKLDEIENPEVKVFNAFVTRLSIWKSAYELGLDQPMIGFGSADGKKELVHYFEKTNQKFLAKYEFPVHNQILDFFVKFGILGALMSIVYLLIPLIVGIKSRNVLLFSFGFIFLISNLFDDFLIRFDGIIFYGIWAVIGFVYYLQKRLLAVDIN